MQKKIQSSIYAMLTVLIVVTSCKKTELNQPPPKIILNNASKLDSFFVSNRKVAGFSNTSENSTYRSNTYQTNSSNNNGWSGSFEDEEVPTILGSQLPNPYTIANMQIAYQLAGSNLIPHVTDLYVKFKPNNYEQLSALDDSLDIELQDYPMDYEVIQDGDYYVTPGTDPEEIPWLYTVVPNGFNFPNGIPYQIISELHIPEDDIFLEALAESIVAGGQYMAGSVSNAKTITRIDLEEPVTVTENRECDSPVLFCVLPPQCLDPNDPACNTGGGGGGGGGGNGGGGNGGGGNGGGQLPNIARGQIRVWDTHIIAGGREEPVKNVRVVIKRWFKVNKVYTNNQGNFQATKRFNNRFKVNVKFRNNLASIRSIRGVRVWQMLFPVHKNIGRFENNFNNVSFLFGRNEGQVDAWRTNWMRLWMAATTHNGLQEHKALAEAEMVGTFSSNNRMNVLLTNHSLGIKSGAEFRAPMHKQKRKDFNEQDVITLAKIAKYVMKGKEGIALAVYNLIKLGIQTQQPDLTFTYRTNIENLSSNQVARNVFGAMTLASLYKATGLAIYDNVTKSIFKFVDVGLSGAAVYYEKWKDLFGSTVTIVGAANSVIGFYNTLTAEKPKYELYHGYAMYMGNFLAWKKYGFNASNVKNQKRESIGNLGSLNSHTRFLEEYNLHEQEDAYRWVPIGFYYDLIDAGSGVELVSGVTDNVDYFTNANLWNALVNGTAPLQMTDFLAKLNAIKPAQTTTTTNLFIQHVQ